MAANGLAGPIGGLAGAGSSWGQTPAGKWAQTQGMSNLSPQEQQDAYTRSQAPPPTATGGGVGGYAQGGGGGGYSGYGGGSGGGGGFQAPGGGTFATSGTPVGAYSTTGSGTQVSGMAPIGAGAYEQQQQSQLDAQLASQSLQERAKLNAEQQQRIMSLISSSGGTAPHVDMGGGGGMSSAETAARNAAFGRAKDQAGLIGNAALQGLIDQMGARGIHGSTIEQEGIGNVLAGAAGGMGEFNREQLLADLARSGEVANTTYQGNITQRGQDLQSKQALLALMTQQGGALY